MLNTVIPMSGKLMEVIKIVEWFIVVYEMICLELFHRQKLLVLMASQTYLERIKNPE